MRTPNHATDQQLAELTEGTLPPRTPGPPEEIRGMTFEQWREANSARIWQLMHNGQCRTLSFNQLAQELWNQL